MSSRLTNNQRKDLKKAIRSWFEHKLQAQHPDASPKEIKKAAKALPISKKILNSEMYQKLQTSTKSYTVQNHKKPEAEKWGFNQETEPIQVADQPST